MSNDEKMYLVQNIEILNDENVESGIAEHEIIADAHIIGGCTSGPYCFGVWEFSVKKEGEERKLYLRGRYKRYSSDDHEWESAKKDGFYHGGGITDELVSLASLFLRRRLKLGPMVRRDDKPMISTRGKGWIDAPLIEGKSNLSDLAEWFKLVEKLDTKKKDHQRFILAVRLYNRAILLIEESPDMAYLDLVSSIEALSNDYDIGKIELSKVGNKLATLVNSIEREDLRAEIEQAILEREKSICHRFVEFICNYVEESFWTEEKRPQCGKIESGQLPALLKKIYNQRSKTLHNGEPFPPYIFNVSILKEEIELGDISIGTKRWYSKDFIPKPHFFERLVNHVLKTFLKRNQTK